MATDQPASSEEVVKLLQQIGLELAFVDPVQENGIAGLKTPIASLSAATLDLQPRD